MSDEAKEILDPTRFYRLQRQDVLEGAFAVLAKTDFFEFVKQAWAVHHPATPLINSWHIYVICRHLEAVSRGRIRNLIINIPPGFAKSLICSVYFPAWEWITRPSLQYIAVSSGKTVVIRDARRHKELIQSRWYQRSFFPEWKLDKSQEAKTYFTTTAKGHRISKTTGQKITGDRGDRQIIDDPHDARFLLTNPQRYEQDNDWIDKVLVTRKNSKDDPRITVMQRLHGLDYTGHQIEKESDACFLVIPNEWDGKPHKNVLGYSDPRTKQGEYIHTGLCDDERKKELLDSMSELEYIAQYQQDPASASGIIFSRNLFQYYRGHELHREMFDFIAASWDTSFGEKKDSDYTAGLVWGVSGTTVWLLACLHARLKTHEVVEAVRGQRQWCAQVWGRAPAVTLIEEKANGPTIRKALEREIPGIEKITPERYGSKSERARGVQVAYQARRVYHPAHDAHSWVEGYEKELCEFPGGRYDDRVDATTNFLKWFLEQDQFYVGKIQSKSA